jgi:hypothetical protein
MNYFPPKVVKANWGCSQGSYPKEWRQARYKSWWMSVKQTRRGYKAAVWQTKPFGTTNFREFKVRPTELESVRECEAYVDGQASKINRRDSLPLVKQAELAIKELQQLGCIEGLARLKAALEEPCTYS